MTSLESVPGIQRLKVPKVFGIGFHKTGTTSLGVALSTLGYTVTGPNCVKDPQISQKVTVVTRRLSVVFDAFQDNPWPLVFREMDEMHPTSKFILTIRPTEKWIRSVVNHFGRSVTPMREWIYGQGCGSPMGNENRYALRYERHNKDVCEYFQNKPGRLLVLPIEVAQEWQPLCEFLGCDCPQGRLPYLNRRLY